MKANVWTLTGGADRELTLINVHTAKDLDQSPPGLTVSASLSLNPRGCDGVSDGQDLIEGKAPRDLGR